MIIIKKASLIILALLIASDGYACGGWTDSYFYYDFLTLKLYATDSQGDDNGHQNNLDQWGTFFDQSIPRADLTELVFATPSSVLTAIRDNTYTGKRFNQPILSTPKAVEALSYLILTRKGNHHSKSNDIWGYTEGEDLDQEIVDEFALLFQKTENLEIKQRILFQLIKFNRYNDHISIALSLYNKHHSIASLPTAIRYYIDDQIAGIWPNKGARADLFLDVALNSEDRRESALNSLGFVSKKTSNQESRALVSSGASLDDINAYLEKLQGEQYTNYEKLEAMYSINPESPYISRLVRNEIDAINPYLFPNQSPFQSKDPHRWLQRLDSAKDKQQAKLRAKKLTQWISLNKTHLHNPPLYDLLQVGLLVSIDDIDQAKKNFDSLNPSSYEEDFYDLISLLLGVELVDVTSASSLQRFAPLLSSHIKKYDTDEFYRNHYTQGIHNFIDYTWDLLGQKFGENRQVARSFFANQQDVSIVDFSDIGMLDILQAYLENTKQSKIDQLLVGNKGHDSSLLEVYKKKSLYYLSILEMGEFEAYNSLVGENDPNPIILPQFVSPDLFKTYTKQNAKLNSSTENHDFMQNYPFILRVKDKASLIEAIKKLLKLSNGEDQTDRMWASLMLGNFVYNISDFGNNFAFRGYTNNVRTETRQTADILKNFDKKNVKDYYEFEQLDTEQAERSTDFYKKAFSLTQSREFKAQLLFLIARNEQNVYYTEVVTNDNFILDGEKIPTYFWWDTGILSKLYTIKQKSYKKNFKALSSYQDTESFKRYYSNCDYLKSYIDEHE